MRQLPDHLCQNVHLVSSFSVVRVAPPPHSIIFVHFTLCYLCNVPLDIPCRFMVYLS
nr:MAG TPA: hypothetical protein [Caudoviricetes sp.]